MQVLILQPRPPFAFDLALAYLRGSPSTVLETVGPASYSRALRLNGKGALVTVRSRSPLPTPGPGPVDSALEVEIRGLDLEPGDIEAADLIVRRLFATDEDLTPLYAADPEGDPVFAALVRRCYGLRPVLVPGLFETLVWAIIGQQINVRFAAKCKRALVDRFGGWLVLDGERYPLFPTPEQLAAASETDLAALQFSRQKIRYILTLAREIAAGRLNLEELRTLPPESAIARLEGLTGVGRWTAEYVLMRGLGHRDSIPAADGGLRRIIGQAYGLGRSASEAEVRTLAENWAGWRSYASFYWWFALQQEMSF